MRFLNVRTIIVCGILFLSAFSANAATLLISNGELTGATGVNVDGTLYDISFVEGSCISLFNDCDNVNDFDFMDAPSANAAAQALASQVLVGNFDVDEGATFGCEENNQDVCNILIPYGFAGSSFLFAQIVNYGEDFDAFDTINPGAGSTNRGADSSDSIGSVYASFTTSEVPLPAAAWLFGTALAGLFGVGRMRSKKA